MLIGWLNLILDQVRAESRGHLSARGHPDRDAEKAAGGQWERRSLQPRPVQHTIQIQLQNYASEVSETTQSFRLLDRSPLWSALLSDGKRMDRARRSHLHNRLLRTT